MTKLRRTISFLLIAIILSASSQICVTANAADADDLQSGELDHSAAAMIERYVRARCASNNN